MNLDLTLEPVFSNFVVSTKLDLNCKVLEDYSYFKKNNHPSYNRSNYGGWQGHINESNDHPEELKKLFDCIYKVGKKVTEELSLETTLSIDNYWINVNGQKNFNTIHLHPLSVFSAVFYIKAPKNCGKIVFVNPITAHPYVYQRMNVLKYNAFNSQEWSYESIENRLLFFPSYLFHYVTPNENPTEDRISIAFNLSCST